MHILIGLVLTLFALYWWLLGHWFARVVMWFPISAMCFMGAIWSRPALQHPSDAGLFAAPPPLSGSMLLTTILLAIVAAWFVSGIPIYVRRYGAPR